MKTSCWHLYRPSFSGVLNEIGIFDDLAEVARRLIALERLPVRTISFEVRVNADRTTDAQALGHLEFQGELTRYTIETETG